MMINKISWQHLDAIEREHGDAFYLVDLEAFHTNFHGLRDAFRAYYRNTELAYSYKTNYLPRLCKLVNDWGGYAEVVSRMGRFPSCRSTPSVRPCSNHREKCTK